MKAFSCDIIIVCILYASMLPNTCFFYLRPGSQQETCHMTENNDLVENVFLLSYANEPRDKKILTQTTHMAFDILADEGTIYN